MHLFVDIDEVLADFVGGACKAHGVGREAALALQPRGVWDIGIGIGSALGRKPLTDDELWEPIDKLGASFWEELEPTPWAAELMKILLEVFACPNKLEVHLLSSPTPSPHSHSGKIEWVHRHFSGVPTLLTKRKELLARHDRILIDDADHNVAAWRREGGKAILFPSVLNSDFEFESPALSPRRKLWSADCLPIVIARLYKLLEEISDDLWI